jgi:hypothetical protein
LVNLEQKTVASLLLDGGLDPERVRDGQIVTDDLDTTLLGEMSPSFPIILIERIFDRNDRVLFDVSEVDVSEFDTGDPFRRVRVGVLEVQVVLSFLVELRGSDIESDFDFALVTGFFDSFAEELE